MYWIHLILLVFLKEVNAEGKCSYFYYYKIGDAVKCNSLEAEEFMFLMQSFYRKRVIIIENSTIPQLEIFLKYSYAYNSEIKIRNSLIESVQIHRSEGCQALSTFDLSFNEIRKIEPLEHLCVRNLLMGHNKIQFLNASSLANQIFLTSLDLSYNNINQYTILNNTRLTSLNLSHNNLENIEGFFINLPQIEVIDLSYNKLKNLSVNDFANLSNIKNLRFSHNNIYTIIDNPSPNFLMKYIFWKDCGRYSRYSRTLDLSYNKLKTLNIEYCNKSSKTSYQSINLEENLFGNLNFLSKSNGTLNTIDSLHIRGHKLKKLVSSNFEGFNLKTLDLSHSIIDSIPPSTFKGLKVKELSLSHNNITSLNNTSFSGLSGLQQLDLSYNPLTTINGLIFSNLSLSTLDISHCFLTRIPEGDFRRIGLSRIYLNHNNIESIELNKFIYPMQILDISHNKINYLEPRIFSGLSVSRYLNLSQNPIQSLEGVFYNTYIENVNLSGISLSEISREDLESLNVTDLDLSNSGILILHNNIFDQQKTLKRLSLDGNLIQKLPDNFFGFNDMLEKLSLVGNPLSNISEDAFSQEMILKYLYLTLNGELLKKRFRKLVFLSGLHIIHSKITYINKYAFKGLISLRKLNFENSTVLGIEPGAFLGLVNVTDFDAKNLFRYIKRLHSKIFVGLEKMTFLNLSYVGITGIEDGAFFGLNELVQLDLSHNNIKDFSKTSFLGLTKLKTLNLSYNWYSTSFPMGIFQDLIELTNLHLSDNQIDSLSTGLFSNLINLNYLDLSKNQIGVIDIDLFYPLKQLEILDLNFNMLNCDESLNLSHLSMLKTIGFGRNQCDCHSLRSNLQNFEEFRVNYTKISVLDFDRTNIEGISCIQLSNNEL